MVDFVIGCALGGIIGLISTIILLYIIAIEDDDER